MVRLNGPICTTYLPSEAEPSRAILAEKRLSTVPGDSGELSTLQHPTTIPL